MPLALPLVPEKGNAKPLTQGDTAGFQHVSRPLLAGLLPALAPWPCPGAPGAEISFVVGNVQFTVLDQMLFVHGCT